MEVFDAMDRHIAPPRTVQLASEKPVCASLSGLGSLHNIKLGLGVCGGGVKELPAVRCKALFLFDHSSGHEAGGSDGRSATAINKGPDWNRKLPYMREGFYANPLGPSYPNIVQRMQFQQGDVLPCDVTVPVGIDLQANSGPAATSPPQEASSSPLTLVRGRLFTPPPKAHPSLSVLQVLPEQLDGRDILRKFVDGSYPGKVVGVDGDHLIVKYERPELEEQLLTVAEVLAYL